MITHVMKITEGKYLLNEKVIVSDFNFVDDHVEYKIDYNEDEVTSEEAQKTADEFILTALRKAAEENT
jgi:hypothetical protein